MQIHDVRVPLCLQDADQLVEASFKGNNLFDIRIIGEDWREISLGEIMNFDSRNLSGKTANYRCGKNNIADRTEPYNQNLLQ